MALQARLNAKLQGYEDSFEKEFQALARQAYYLIKERTPVDTGRAKDGWTINGNGVDIIISNEVPYIVYLENGHSSQAPHGMVRITLEELYRNRATSILRRV